jgi:hypothetical protein
LMFSKATLKFIGHNAATYIELSRDGAVVTATRLRAGPSGVRIMAGEGDFFPNVQTVSGAHLASCYWVLGTLSPSGAAESLDWPLISIECRD